MVACSWDRQLLASSCMPLIEKGVGHEAYTIIVRNSLFECNEEFRFSTLLLVSKLTSHGSYMRTPCIYLATQYIEFCLKHVL